MLKNKCIKTILLCMISVKMPSILQVYNCSLAFINLGKVFVIGGNFLTYIGTLFS